MLRSRGLVLSRLSNFAAKDLLAHSVTRTLNKQIIRHGHDKKWYYRRAPEPYSKKERLPYDILGAIFWWWVLWHLFTDYHELLGFDLPDPSSFTDEELGIPPED